MSDKTVYTSIVAFSTPSGPLHVGHALGYVAAGATSTYESLKSNKEIYFPFGTHSTGKDLLKIVNSLREGTDPIRYGLTEKDASEIISSKRPVDSLLNKFTESYAQDLDALGIKLDKDSYFSTHHKIYEPFLHWTLNKLNENKLIISTKNYRPFCESCDEIKSIQQDQSEVIVKGTIDWNNIKIDKSELPKDLFFCKAHPEEEILVKETEELAINYGDSDFQKKTIELIKTTLKTFPKSYKSDLESIINSRREKPFERKSNLNLGSSSPFNPNKTVEALSDSNIYMEFYGLMKALNTGILNESHFTEEFFDYIFLNKGDKITLQNKFGIKDLNEVQKYIESYSTIDLNVAGSEHKEVHFPFSLFTHAAVLPDKYFPKELILTSNVMRNGEKMSKSKGNVLFLGDVIKDNLAKGLPGLGDSSANDAIRYFLLVGQPLDKNFDWNDTLFNSIGYKRMKKYVLFASQILSGEVQEKTTPYDGWFSTKSCFGIENGLKFFEERNFRSAFIEGFDSIYNAMGKYQSLNDGKITPLLQKVLLKQLQFAKPIIPRIADELYTGFVGQTIKNLPTYSDLKIDMEEYDKAEHEFNGANFINNILGFVNSRVGQLRGQKLINKNTALTINLSSQYVVEIVKPLLESKAKSLTGFNYKIESINDSKINISYNGNFLY